MLFDVGRKMRKISNSFGARELMVPYYLAEFPMQLFPLHHLARMLRMIKIIDDDVTMTVEIAMVIEEIKEVMGVVVVMDKSSGTKTKVRPVSPVSSLT